MIKWLWIVAGPNGAGKSTHTVQLMEDLQASGIPGDSIIKLNADEKTAELQKQFPDRPLKELNLQAAQETDAALTKAVVEDETYILVETVLSSEKYKKVVLEAKGRGYNIGLTYVSVHPPELILGRIRNRVAKGGHNVDDRKALDRYGRSHVNLIWFAQHSDKVVILDNSARRETGPVLVAVKSSGKKLIHKAKGVNPALDRAIWALRKDGRSSPSPNTR